MNLLARITRRSELRIVAPLCAIAALAGWAAPAGAVSLCFTADPQITITRLNSSPITTNYESAWLGFDGEGSGCEFGSCGGGTHPFRWTISRSDTDPLDNSGAPSGPVFFLYLWLECDAGLPSDERLWAAVLHVEASDDVQILGYTAADGTLNIGTATDLELAFGVSGSVQTTPFVAGAWPCFVEGPVPVDGTTWAGIKDIYR
ncbi:MAG: hypothetical protein R3B81_12120 [bacterium]